MALRAVIDHPKTKRLQLLLSAEFGRTVNMRETLGTLEAIWHFCGRFTPRGDIGRYTDEEIETWVEWDGAHGRLIAILIQARWLDEDGAHRLLIHDWHHHADESTRKQLKRLGLSFAGETCLLDAPQTDMSRTCPGHVLDMSGLPGPESGPGPESEPESARPREEAAATNGHTPHTPDDEVLPLIQRVLEAVADVPKFAGHIPAAADVRQLMTTIEAEAPSQAAILSELPGFIEYHRRRQHGTMPIKALSGWFSRCLPFWAQTRARAPDQTAGERLSEEIKEIVRRRQHDTA